MIDVVPVSVTGGTVQLFNVAQRSITIINTSGTATPIYVGSGSVVGTANSLPVTGTLGPLGPLTGAMWATSSGGTASAFVIITSI